MLFPHRQIGDILCNVVRCVDFGRDFEQQLQWYVDARGAFANLDVVLSQLVQVSTKHSNLKSIVIQCECSALTDWLLVPEKL